MTPDAELTAAGDWLNALIAEATQRPWMSATSNGRKDGVALIGAVENRGTGRAVAVLAETNVPRRHADARLIVALVNAGPEVVALLRASSANALASGLVEWPLHNYPLRDLARAILTSKPGEITP